MRGISKSGPFSTFFQVRQTYCRFPLEFHINSRVREVNRILLRISRDVEKFAHVDRHFLKIHRNILQQAPQEVYQSIILDD